MTTLRPSMAPRWNNTTIFFLFGIVLAATARCKKAGRAAIPSMARPPFLMKYRREMFIAVSPGPLAPLKLWRAENQTCDQAFVYLLYGIVEARLQDLRVTQARLESLSC